MNAQIRYRCPVCHELHEQKSSAEACCKPFAREVYVCGNCQEEYFSGVEAGACCFAKAKNPVTVPNYGTIYR